MRRPVAAAVVIGTVAVLAAVGLVVASSVSSGPAAATVDGSDIARDTFTDQLATLSDHPEFAEAVYGVSPAGDGEGNVNSTFAAAVLSTEILAERIRRELADRGVVPSEGERDLVVDVLQQLPSFTDLPEGDREGFVDRTADLLALGRDLAGVDATDEAQIEAYFADNSDQFEQSCIRHILVETEATAADLGELLEAGADFAAVADVSTVDPGNVDQASGEGLGGDLGCGALGQFVVEFSDAVASADLDEVVGPVQTEFGFHLIVVYDRRTLTLEDARAEIENLLVGQSQTALGEWLILEAWEGVGVSVDPRYGTWCSADSVTPTGPCTDAVLNQVIPPEPPAGTLEDEPSGDPFLPPGQG